jgi:hypothetical protein
MPQRLGLRTPASNLIHTAFYVHLLITSFGVLSFSSGLDASDFVVGPIGGTCGTEAKFSFAGPLFPSVFHNRRDLRAIIQAEFHHRGISRLM